MKVTNKTFDNLRLYAEILGYILTFALAVSEIVGFKYGVELTAIVGAFNIMLGSILNALRKNYNNKDVDDLIDELEDVEEETSDEHLDN